MNEELEALENIEGNCDLFDEGYQWDNEFSKQFDKDIDIIENALKKKEKTDKALELLKKCCLLAKYPNNTFELSFSTKIDISKEDYDLLKEVFYD